jgi:hypothetical protein
VALSTWSGEITDGLVDDFVSLTATFYDGQPVNDRRVVHWRHVENPCGPSVPVELVKGDEHVGRMWILRQLWFVRDKPAKGANPIDFLIREDCRSLPNFLALFKATMKSANDIADFVIHSSNPLTDGLYQKFMKYKPVTELDGAIAALRPFAAANNSGLLDLRLLGRLLDRAVQRGWRAGGWVSRISGVTLREPPNEADQRRVVDQLIGEQTVCGARSPEQRVWRFRGAGPITYTEQWIYFRKRARGYVVFSDRDIDGFRGRFVVDIVLPGRPARRMRAALWLQMLGDAARSDRDALVVFYNRANPQLSALVGFPLLTVSRTRLPQRIPVFVRPSVGSDIAGLEEVDWSSGYFVLADFDMF